MKFSDGKSTFMKLLIFILTSFLTSMGFSQNPEFFKERLETIEKLRNERKTLQNTSELYSDKHIQLFKDQIQPMREWLGLSMDPEKIPVVDEFLNEIETIRIQILNEYDKTHPLYLKWLDLLRQGYTMFPFEIEALRGRGGGTTNQIAVDKQIRSLQRYEKVKEEEYKKNERMQVMALSILDPIKYRDPLFIMNGSQYGATRDPFQKEINKRFGDTEESVMIANFASAVNFVYDDQTPQAEEYFNGLVDKLYSHAEKELQAYESATKEAKENYKPNVFDSAAYAQQLIDAGTKKYREAGKEVPPALLQAITVQAQIAAAQAKALNQLTNQSVQKSLTSYQNFQFSPELWKPYKKELAAIQKSKASFENRKQMLITSTEDMFYNIRIGKYNAIEVASRLKYQPAKLLPFITSQLKRTDEDFHPRTRAVFEIILRNYQQEKIQSSASDVFKINDPLTSMQSWGKYRNVILNIAYEQYRNGGFKKGVYKQNKFTTIYEILSLKGGDFRSRRLILQTIQRTKIAPFMTAYRDYLKDQEAIFASQSLTNEEKAKRIARNYKQYTNLIHLISPYVRTKDIGLNLSGKRRTMPNTEALVSIDRFERPQTKQVIYMITLVTRNGIEVMYLENGKELEGKDYKNYINRIKYKLEDSESYNKFWAPIAAKLPNATKIHLVTDGIYHKLNLNSLKNPTTGQYLDETTTIIRLNDIIDFKRPGKSKFSKTGNPGVLFGRPDYYSDDDPDADKQSKQRYISRDFANATSITDLPATEIEVDSIASLLQNQGEDITVYLRADATEANLKGVGNPKLIHIATHGFFEEDFPVNPKGDGFFSYDEQKFLQNPLLRSGLVLAGAGLSLKGENRSKEDGIVTSQEISFLSLENTQLVTLSACETGLGEIANGEGVMGLQRAFLLAGADAVLISLWEVDDFATKSLMTNLYRNWLQDQSTLRAAFSKAKNQLRDEYPHPYYWAPFVLLEN